MPYTLPAWQDSPSPATPISSANLLMANTAIQGLDSRVGMVETGKLASGLVNAKGKLISSDNTATPTALLPGNDGQVLSADLASPLGLKWVAPASGGGVSSVTAGDTSITVAGTGAAPTVAINATGTPGSATFLRGDRVWATPTGGVPTSRLITSGTGLSGGGDLTADRTLIVVGDTTTQRVEVAKNGTQVGTNARKRVNLIEGANVTITAADNSGSNQLDVTIAAATTGSTGIPASTVTTKGDLIVATANAAVGRLGVGLDNTLLTASGAAPTGTAWNTLNSVLSGLISSKGDLVTSNGTTAGRLGVGGNGQVLTAASGQPTGLQWATAATGVPLSTFQAVGDLVAGTGSGTVGRLPQSATDGFLLTSDVFNANGVGVTWAAPALAYGTAQDEGLALTQRPIINFVGPSVTATDNSGAGRTDVTITESNITPGDHGLISWTFDVIAATASSTAINGSVYLMKVKIPFSQAATKIYWYCGVAGSGATAVSNFAGIYSPAGTLLRSVGIDSDVAATAGVRTDVITSTTVAPPFVWVALVFNATTPPQPLRGGPATALNAIGFTAATYRFGISSLTSQLTLPSTITPSGNTQGPSFWAAIGA